MAKRTSNRLDESTLTKGQRRKLNALRKSVGDEIGEQAFATWLSSQSQAAGAAADANAGLIVDTLWPLVQEGPFHSARRLHFACKVEHHLAHSRRRALSIDPADRLRAVADPSTTLTVCYKFLLVGVTGWLTIPPNEASGRRKAARCSMLWVRLRRLRTDPAMARREHSDVERTAPQAQRLSAQGPWATRSASRPSLFVAWLSSQSQATTGAAADANAGDADCRYSLAACPRGHAVHSARRLPPQARARAHHRRTGKVLDPRTPPRVSQPPPGPLYRVSTAADERLRARALPALRAPQYAAVKRRQTRARLRFAMFANS